MARVLFINTPPRRCGVHSFGETTADILTQSTRLEFHRAHLPEDTTFEEYLNLLHEQRPDFVLYNYHHWTMPWLEGSTIPQARASFPDIRHLSIAHDNTPQLWHLDAAIQLDPTFEETFLEKKVGRLIQDFTPTRPARANVIGSFGYAGKHKNFPQVVDLANAEFDEATVRIHMPSGYYADPDGQLAEQIAHECRQRAKPGITVEITHHFMSIPQLIQWLSENTVNVYLYDFLGEAGISSAIDYSLAAQRPIAVSDSHMFRHLLKTCPGVRLATRSLKAIIDDGFAPLEPLRQRWSADNLLRDYERIFDIVGRRPLYDLRANRVLTPEDREALKPVVAELHRLEPAIMSRKIPDAVFQNAFIFQQVLQTARRSDEMILVGGFEDPIGPALQKLGYNIRISDPVLDGKDGHDVYVETIEQNKRYDIVISCSGIEHVHDDETFVYYLYSMLKPGGTAFLTTDYDDNWHEGMNKPNSDVRIYSSARNRRLANVLPRQTLLDPPTWGPSKPTFEIVGAQYGFCSLAFAKPLVVPVMPIAPTPMNILENHLRSLVGVREQQTERIRLLDSHVAHLDGTILHLRDKIAACDQTNAATRQALTLTEANLCQAEAENVRLRAVVDRLGSFKDASPATVGVVRTIYGLTRCLPSWLRGVFRSTVGLMRRAWGMVRGTLRPSQGKAEV